MTNILTFGQRPPGIRWWLYDHATVTNVVDGDTLDVSVDPGFRIVIRQRVRLFGVDAPELHAANAQEREAAEAAKAWLTQYNDCPVRLLTHKTDSFGRYLGIVYTWNEHFGVWECVNELLVKAGHAQLASNFTTWNQHSDHSTWGPA